MCVCVYICDIHTHIYIKYMHRYMYIRVYTYICRVAKGCADSQSGGDEGGMNV